MTISIIIPTYNEAGHIGKLVQYLAEHNDGSIIDIIVSDGGSVDETVLIAGQAGATVIIAPKKCRAIQLNFGASHAQGDIFYFIHADSLPPKHFITDIKNAIKKQYNMGRYKTQFDSDKKILLLNAWFTRFDLFICMGGDQTFFIERKIFERCTGFNEEMMIMEEYEFCNRAKKIGKYIILNGAALISARKYDCNSWLQVQLANSKIVRMYKRGASQKEMTEVYSKMLNLNC